MPFTKILVDELRKISCDPHKFNFSTSDTKAKLTEKGTKLYDLFFEIDYIFNTDRDSQHLDDHFRLLNCFGTNVGVATGDGWARVKDMKAIENYAQLKGYILIELPFDMYANLSGHKSIMAYRAHKVKTRRSTK